MLSESDKKVRSKGIGSSEIAMLVYIEVDGEMKPLSPWGGRHKLWRVKTGREPYKKPQSRLPRGQFMEEGLIKWFCADNDYIHKKPETITHKKYPYVVDSVDGLLWKKSQPNKDMPFRCLEAKTAHWTKRHEWGTPGTDEIPLYYLTQCQWHIGAWSPLDMACDVTMDDGTSRSDYLIRFDEELYGSLVMLAEQFWIDYVEKDKEPPVDDFTETTEWLARYLKNTKGEGYIEADDEAFDAAREYRKHIIASKENATKADEYKERLMRFIDFHDGVSFGDSGARINWKQSKDRHKLNKDGLINDLAEMAKISADEMALLKEKHTTIEKGSRIWRPDTLLKVDL